MTRPRRCSAAENRDLKRVRSYAMQPPTIPHKHRQLPDRRFVNRCMMCHARTRAGETQATPISITHYTDRDGNFLVPRSPPRRYFCDTVPRGPDGRGAARRRALRGRGRALGADARRGRTGVRRRNREDERRVICSALLVHPAPGRASLQSRLSHDRRRSSAAFCSGAASTPSSSSRTPSVLHRRATRCA